MSVSIISHLDLYFISFTHVLIFVSTQIVILPSSTMQWNLISRFRVKRSILNGAIIYIGQKSKNMWFNLSTGTRSSFQRSVRLSGACICLTRVFKRHKLQNSNRKKSLTCWLKKVKEMKQVSPLFFLPI